MPAWGRAGPTAWRFRGNGLASSYKAPTKPGSMKKLIRWVRSNLPMAAGLACLQTYTLANGLESAHEGAKGLDFLAVVQAGLGDARTPLRRGRGARACVSCRPRRASVVRPSQSDT